MMCLNETIHTCSRILRRSNGAVPSLDTMPATAPQIAGLKDDSGILALLSALIYDLFMNSDLVWRRGSQTSR